MSGSFVASEVLGAIVGDSLVRGAYHLGMKAVTASLVAVVLLGLLAVCPLPACAMPGSDSAHHSCCHKPKPQPLPCPMPTVQDCAYFILEKGKTAQPAVYVSPLALPCTPLDLGTPDQFSAPRTEVRLPDSAGLYLRVRVLLI